MHCCHDYVLNEGFESAFSIETSPTIFGPGTLAETGEQAKALGLSRVALFTDRTLSELSPVGTAYNSLVKAGLDVALYDEVRIEPTDTSFLEAARFATQGSFDGFVSVGGGSVIDTAKAANLYSSFPADLLAYVNPPIGSGRPVPRALKPHIACPTTAGTGSENTGIAVFDLVSMKSKTGIASKKLRPTLAIVDTEASHSLPKNVAASGAFDVLSHALESFTARAYSQRAAPSPPTLRPASQGANPWSDLGCREALRLLGQFLVRGVNDAADHEAREKLVWASTLAGIAFGNAGCHLPHGMSYSVSGMVREFSPDGYPKESPIIPHGISVIVNAPAVFRWTALSSPARHLEAANLLGHEATDAAHEDTGDILAEQLIRLMRQTDMPNGLRGLGYSVESGSDLEALTAGALPQRRLLDNAPRPVEKEELLELYQDAASYW